ncbi:MAG: hypothetical protein HZB67_00940 [Candidatus Aenigmarchaeota archaeon]|nr:hypothetical protein [Candidatus Aenigmarchaeota archaeon]
MAKEKDVREKPKGGNTELVLGLLGGIFGFFAGILALGIGGIGSVFGASGAGQIMLQAGVAILFSLIGIVGAALVKGRPKMGGWIMIISAFVGLIAISLFFLLSFVLLLVGGIMGVRRK